MENQKIYDLIEDLHHRLLSHPDVNQLCRQARVSRQSVWRFLNRERHVSLLTLARLCVVLEIKLDSQKPHSLVKKNALNTNKTQNAERVLSAEEAKA